MIGEGAARRLGRVGLAALTAALVLLPMACRSATVAVPVVYDVRVPQLGTRHGEPVQVVRSRLSAPRRRDARGDVVLTVFSGIGGTAAYTANSLEAWVDKAVLAHLGGTRHPAGIVDEIPRSGVVLTTDIVEAGIDPDPFASFVGLTAAVDLQFTVYRDGEVIGELIGRGRASAPIEIYSWFGEAGVGRQMAQRMDAALTEAMTKALPVITRCIRDTG